MLKGAIYKITEFGSKHSALGWDKIKVLEVRPFRTVTYKTNRQGFVDDSDLIATTTRTDYEFICLCDDTELTSFWGDDWDEDLMQCYILANPEAFNQNQV